MERGHEAETQESSRRRAWQARWSGAERGQTPEWPQGSPGQKPQEENCRPAQRASSTTRSPQEIIAAMIASIRARFGNRVIGLGHQGIRFAGHYRQRDMADAHPA
jgi:hypothetical protein